MPAGKDLLTLWAPREGNTVFYDEIFLAHPGVNLFTETFEGEVLKLGIGVPSSGCGLRSS